MTKDQKTSRGNLKKNHTTRVGKNFYKNMKEIRDTRLELKKDKVKIPIRVITNLIVKHNYWPKIKEEIISLTDVDREDGGEDE